ncbi:MAG: hypothetical protein ACFFD8_00555 [Candidatus Thorarchaeota archaeon]
MSSSGAGPKKPQSPFVSSRTRRYVLRPRRHPNGWKLEITDATDQSLLEITSRSTSPIRYHIESTNSTDSELLVIKPANIGDVIRYSLMKADYEQLSLNFTISSPRVSLRNHNRNIIAHFTPLTPYIILLRTTTSLVARLRIKQSPNLLGFVFQCETTPETKWLHGVMLFSIAYIVAWTSNTHLRSKDFEGEKVAENAASP